MTHRKNREGEDRIKSIEKHVHEIIGQMKSFGSLESALNRNSEMSYEDKIDVINELEKKMTILKTMTDTLNSITAMNSKKEANHKSD